MNFRKATWPERFAAGRMPVRWRGYAAGLLGLLMGGLLCAVAGQARAQEPPSDTATQAEPVAPALNLPATIREAGALQLHQAVERDIAGGQADVYTIDLDEGQFVHVVVEQKGVHISLGLIAPDGRRLNTANHANGDFGIEPASLIAPSKATYKVQVFANNALAPAGSYRIEVTDLRAPTADDQNRVEAERTVLLAEALKRRGDKDSRAKAVEAFTSAAALWHDLKDAGAEAQSLHAIGGMISVTGKPREAVKYLNEALRLQRAAGDRAGEAATLNDLGVCYRILGDLPKAQEEYSQSLAIDHALGNRASEATVLNNLGRVHRSLGEFAKAADYYNQALTLHRAMGSRWGEAATLSNLGAVYQAMGEYQKALDFYNQALPLRRAVSDRAGEATTLGSLGALYKARGEVTKALDYYNQSLSLQRAIGDRYGEAGTLGAIGSAYMALGEMPKALDYFNQSLAIKHEVGDPSSEASTLNSLGLAYRKLGDMQKALDYYSRALPMQRAVGNRPGEATTLNNLGAAHSALGDVAEALDDYNQALALHHAVGDRAGEAVTLNNIGGLHRRMGEMDQALDFYNRALAMHQAVGDRDGEAGTLDSLGGLHRSQGEMQKALQCLNQALTIYRAIGDRDGEAASLNGAAGVYADLGETAKALDAYNQALAIDRAIGDRDAEAATTNNLGLIYRRLDETDKALDAYQRALVLIREVGDRAAEATTLNNLGELCRSMGDKAKALDYYTQALPLHRAVKDRAGEAVTLNNLASLEESMGHNDQALPFFLQSLALERSVGEPQGEGITLCNLMHYWRAQKNYPLAIFFGKQAINRFQQIRENITGLDRELQESYLGTVTSAYRRLADLLVAEGRLPEAERVLGLLKEQEYTEFTRGGSGAPSTAPLALTPRENDASALTGEALEWLTLRDKDSRTPGEEARMKALGEKLQAANSATASYFQQLQQALGAPGGAAHARDVSSETSDSQSLLRDLGAGTVAVYTLVLDTEVEAIVVTPAVMTPHTIPITRAELGRKVLALLEALKNPTSDPRPAAGELYRVLVAPITADLAGAQAHTVLWSLDDVLRYVPVNALYDGKGYLVERYDNVLFTAANTSRLEAHPEVSDWRALGMGVSKRYEADLNPLAAVPAELDGVVHDSSVAGSHGPVPGRIMLDDAFTEKDMADQLWKKYPLVHIASHFVLEPGSEEQSFLLLGGKDQGGQGYHLSLAELQHDPNLDFHSVELLTLSACETGTGGGGDGREVDGLGMLAEKKGAKAVLATLWSVNDASTSQLMTDFYRRWTASKGVSKIDALRQAQLDLLFGRDPAAQTAAGAAAPSAGAAAPEAPAASRGFEVHTSAPAASGAKYSHPYYWAPFILMGNWQ